jgi:hypothetical protein
MFSLPVTDAERRGWQRRATRVLERLLGLDLPPLTWTVAANATLVGRVLGPDDTRRTRWQTWVTALAATAAPESHGEGVTNLRATAPDRDDRLVQVVLLAAVFGPEPDGR